MPAGSASAPVPSTVTAINRQTTPLKKGNCFSCGKPGHWALQCPTKRSTGSSFSQPNFKTRGVASPVNSEVICPCGAGFCLRIVAKNTRDVYYKCPAESWMSCGFFMMHNKLDSRGVRHLEYPICECGAGVCLLGRDAATGREFFKCRVPKGKGACPFRQWLDEPISCMKSVTGEKTDYLRTPPRSGERVNGPLSEEDASHRKRLRITELDGPANANSVVLSSNSMASLVSSDKEGSSVISMELEEIPPELLIDIMEYDYSLTENDESSCKLHKTPESEENIVSLSPNAQLSPYSAVSLGSSNGKEIPAQVETILQDFDIDEDLINEVIAFESTLTNVDQRLELSYDSQVEEVVNTALGKLPDHKTVQRLQANFERRIIAAATDHPQGKCISTVFGARYIGWLSRLAFASPRCSILPLDIYVFPNFHPSYAPQGIGSQSVSNSVAGKSLSVPQQSSLEDVPATNLNEPSALGSPPYVAEPDNEIAAAILEAFGQAAMLIQTNFITRLESMNPSSHESMMKEANTVFASLDHLKVDYRPFHQQVNEFIAAASSLNQIELSVRKDALFQDRLNKEKLRLEQLSSEHSSVTKSFTCSQEREQSLINEAEEVRNRLLQIEKQVISCQMATNDLNIRLAELSDQINECQNKLKSASLEAEAAQRLSLQKEAERSAALDAFEKAKFQLRNKVRASYCSVVA